MHFHNFQQWLWLELPHIGISYLHPSRLLVNMLCFSMPQWSAAVYLVHLFTHNLKFSWVSVQTCLSSFQMDLSLSIKQDFHARIDVHLIIIMCHLCLHTAVCMSCISNDLHRAASYLEAVTSTAFCHQYTYSLLSSRGSNAYELLHCWLQCPTGDPVCHQHSLNGCTVKQDIRMHQAALNTPSAQVRYFIVTCCSAQVLASN